MNRWQNCVEDFHRAIGQRMALKSDALKSLNESSHRLSLILEEVSELAQAVVTEDVFDAVDGLVDIIYVCIGTASIWGVDLDPFFSEVHKANMRKVGGAFSSSGKLAKPVGWIPPNHLGALDRHAATYGGDGAAMGPGTLVGDMVRDGHRVVPQEEPDCVASGPDPSARGNPLHSMLLDDLRDARDLLDRVIARREKADGR